MPENSDEFYRISKLPPYVFAVINEMRARARAEQIDVIDLGMGNPDGPTPRVVVNKLIEAARNARNHRSRNRAAFRISAKKLSSATRRITTLIWTPQLRRLSRLAPRTLSRIYCSP